MNISTSITVSGKAPDNLIPKSIGKQMYDMVTPQAAQFLSSNLYANTIAPIRARLMDYSAEFDNAVNDYMAANNLLSQMKNSLNPIQGKRGQKINIRPSKLNNNKNATQQLKSVMLKGYKLMLDIRQQLTGQQITTKFIVQGPNGKFYEITNIDSVDQVLSKFGGGTMSNPFSLAYEFNASSELLTPENEISSANVLSLIWSLKPQYLERKRLKWLEQGVVRTYKNIYFDAKDAEIYELYQQEPNRPALDLDEYESLRANMGGRGGYATPFYKMGDVSSVQVKFFNLTENSKAAANFARFSLLRDRVRELANIFSISNPMELRDELIAFFTEKEGLVTNAISQEFNSIAKEMIATLFKGYS